MRFAPGRERSCDAVALPYRSCWRASGDVPPLDRSLVRRISRRSSARKRDASSGARSDAELALEQLVHGLRGGLGVAAGPAGFLDDRLEEVGRLALADQNARVIPGETVVADEARLLLVRQLGQVRREMIDLGRVELERQKIRIREVAVVVCLLLTAHGAGLAL